MSAQPHLRLLITGATGAIGGEIAAQAAAAGHVIGVHGSTGISAAAAIVRLSHRVSHGHFTAAPADFRDENAIASMVDAFAQAAGGLDAVIHCGITGSAGVTGPFVAIDAKGLAEHASLVLAAFQRLCWAALPHMNENGGTIIGFASDAGRFAAPRQAVIGAAFGGIMAFVRNLALEVARDGVRVHCIAPSFVANTPVFDAHPTRAAAAQARAGLGLPTPADIAPLALFLCGPGARRMTGQVISVNGGLNA